MGEHSAPDEHPILDGLKRALHLDDDGPAKGWSAADVDPSEYYDDDYAARFPVVSDGAE